MTRPLVVELMHLKQVAFWYAAQQQVKRQFVWKNSPNSPRRIMIDNYLIIQFIYDQKQHIYLIVHICQQQQKNKDELQQQSMHNQLIYNTSVNQMKDSGCSFFEQQSQICLIKFDYFGQQVEYLPTPQLYPAYNNTLIFYYPPQINKIKQYRIDGGVLAKELVLDGFRIDGIFMFSERCVGIWAFNFTNCYYFLIQWNLETGELIKYQWQQTDVLEKYSVRVLTFTSSKLFCVIMSKYQDHTNKNMNELRISYIKYPLNSENDKLTHHFEFTEHSLEKYQFPDKLNNNSAIVWRKMHDPSEPDFSTIHIFSLKTQEIREHKIDHLFIDGRSWYSTEISDIWEPKQGIIYVEFRSFLSYRKMENSLLMKSLPQQYLQDYKWLSQPINKQKWYQFLWHINQNKWSPLKQGIKQTENFSYSVQFTNGYRKTHHYCLLIQPISPLRPQIMFKPRKLKFVDIYTNQVVANQTIKEQERLFFVGNKDNVKYYYPQHDCFTQISYQIIDKIVQYRDQLKVLIVTKKMVPFPFPVSFYLVFLMTQLVQDCDDDLLDAVINITSDENL